MELTVCNWGGGPHRAQTRSERQRMAHQLSVSHDTPPVRIPIDINRLPVPHGDVHVLCERCKGCEYCIAFCPTEVLVWSSRVNKKGYRFPTVAAGKEAACVNCRFCDYVCPEMAIYVTAADDSCDTKGRR